MQLNNVVLPEPFGPIRENISLFFTEKETSLSATKPEKRIVKLSIMRSVIKELGLCSHRALIS